MKLPKLLLALLIPLVSLQFCFAQEKSSVELFDYLGASGCSNVRERTDNYLMTLKNESGAVGYVVFYAGASLSTFSFYENAVKSHVKYRRFPEERIKFIYARPQSDFKAEYWMSRNGEKPQIEESKASLALNQHNRYLFAQDAIEIDKINGKLDYFHASECYIEGVNFNLLAKYLEANPEMNAEIFVYNKSARRARQVIKLFTREAGEAYKIPLNRLKINYTGIDTEFGEFPARVSGVKIRFVPQKNQN